MITRKMKKFLESDEFRKGRHTILYCVRMNRIQKRIDKELDMLLWLAINKPSVFHVEPTINEYGHELKHKRKYNGESRIRKLLRAIQALNPSCDIELVLKNLEGARNE